MATPAATLDPLTHGARPGIEPMPLQQPELLPVGFLTHRAKVGNASMINHDTFDFFLFKMVCPRAPMFTAAHFTTAKTWKQPMCPSTEEWIKVCVYKMEYYLAIKENEILPFAAKWMDRGIIILTEESQRKTNTGIISLICGSKE